MTASPAKRAKHKNRTIRYERLRALLTPVTFPVGCQRNAAAWKALSLDHRHSQ